MSRTGPARANLTAQLQEKLRQDREQIEALTSSELKQLAESLSRSSRAALDAMESDTRERLARMRREMDEIATRQRRWPLWTALSSAVIALSIFALLWMATSWARSDLRTALRERYEARQLLDDLREQTRGMTLQTSSAGRTYVVGPEGSEGNVCNGMPCIGLPED
ncbi:hypothetical protein PARU111607_17315 [Palleronia rufa]